MILVAIQLIQSVTLVPTNFYTNSTYSESSDPGVSGTKEATVRLGVIKHDVTDYSSGYLSQVQIEAETQVRNTLLLRLDVQL